MMASWIQDYTPLGSLWASALAAALPIVFLFFALAVWRLRSYWAAAGTVGLTLLLAVFVYRMPAGPAILSVIYGFAYGLWPISWIIIPAVLLYKMTVHTGQFEIIRASVVSVTADQRLQAVLVAFSFGAFLEGAAGFGAPVAISSALLVGLGFEPLYAAGLCLIANTAPVAFGSMGIPMIVGAKVTGLPVLSLAAMAGRQLPLLSLLVPFWLVAIMDGWRGIRETWPALAIGGISFGVTQFFSSNYLGPELPDMTSALASLLALTLFLKVWHPRHIFRFDGQGLEHAPEGREPLRAGKVLKAWSPFMLLTGTVTLWSQTWFKNLFLPGGRLSWLTLSFPVPGLDGVIQKGAPIVSEPTPYEAVFKLDLLSAVGTAVLLTSMVAALLLRLNARTYLRLFGETLKELGKPVATIGLVLAFAFAANYSALSYTLGLGLAATGVLFPFFSPILGWLGVFLTGSDTSSNALFANLQAVTGKQIGVDPLLLVAANSTGGVTGKMISPQSIAVACAATGLVGRESDLFRFTLKHSILFALIMGVLNCLQAYVFSWMIPR